MAPGVRILNCAGPGMALKSLPEAPEGSTKRPRRHAGGAFAEVLEQPTSNISELLEQATPEIRRSLNSQRCQDLWLNSAKGARTSG
eukprot:4939642-Alexandrium_andersonii.AAC.1